LVLERGLSNFSVERISLAAARYSEKSEESSSCFAPVSGSRFSSTALMTFRSMFKHREKVVKTHLGGFRGERGHRKYCYIYNKSAVPPPVEMGVSLRWFL